MKKGSGTKERISITIDRELVEEIKSHCEKNLIKVSTYIEKILKEEFNNEK